MSIARGYSLNWLYASANGIYGIHNTIDPLASAYNLYKSSYITVLDLHITLVNFAMLSGHSYVATITLGGVKRNLFWVELTQTRAVVHSIRGVKKTLSKFLNSALLFYTIYSLFVCAQFRYTMVLGFYAI